jgi:hypothetical protein
MDPFPVDSIVKLRLIKEKYSFDVVAKVVHSKAGMGMGLSFNDADADQIWVLEEWLGELAGELPFETPR